jgi:hypothetical protein
MNLMYKLYDQVLPLAVIEPEANFPVSLLGGKRASRNGLQGRPQEILLSRIIQSSLMAYISRLDFSTSFTHFRRGTKSCSISAKSIASRSLCNA